MFACLCACVRGIEQSYLEQCQGYVEDHADALGSQREENKVHNSPSGDSWRRVVSHVSDQAAAGPAGSHIAHSDGRTLVHKRVFTSPAMSSL